MWRSALIAAGLMIASPAAADPAEQAATPIPCPAAVGEGVRCTAGRAPTGAWYVTAIPADWNRRLIVHAHGGPRLGEPRRDDELEDLERFAVMVRAGYAWTGSTYRRGGYGVRMAAEDVEISRRIFWRDHGRPERTLLHGQSWGGNVAAKASELYAPAGGPYDGVLLTNGVLAGGTRAYGFRADLRAVYQFYCRNHPATREPTYPLWQGLPPNSDLTRAELERRVNQCTGVNEPAERRMPEQARRLEDILAVTAVAEGQLVAHLAWSTFTFRDLAQRVGGSVFDNRRTVYRGSSDDQALNAGVERFAADRAAVVRLAHDADLTGEIGVPTLSLHALHDPVASHAMEADYARTVAGAGRAALLVQAATDEAEHSKLQERQYLVVLEALERWIATGERPDPLEFQSLCLGGEASRPDCRFIAPPTA